MQNLRFFYMCGVLWLAGNLVGCNAPVQSNCPKPVGVYNAHYALLSGTCQGEYQPFPLKFASDNSVNTQNSEIRLADVVITEITLKGCELKLSQRVTSEGATTKGAPTSASASSPAATTRSAIAGTLGVVDETNLSGTVVRTDFMPDQSVRCSAEYEAWYTRDNLLLGAAARD